MTRCDCTQGTEENGWHETVGPECYEKELEKWGNLQEWIKSDEFKALTDMIRRENLKEIIEEDIATVESRIEDLERELWELEDELEALESELEEINRAQEESDSE